MVIANIKQGGDMKNMWLRNKKSKLSLNSEILLGALALAFIVGLGSAAYAASDNTDNNAIFSRGSLFNPFTLRTVTPVTGSSSSPVILSGPTTRPPIWIPYRPAVRTPIRPPWVPGKPSWAPGPPPWHPGQPPWAGKP